MQFLGHVSDHFGSITRCCLILLLRDIEQSLSISTFSEIVRMRWTSPQVNTPITWISDPLLTLGHIEIFSFDRSSIPLWVLMISHLMYRNSEGYTWQGWRVKYTLENNHMKSFDGFELFQDIIFSFQLVRRVRLRMRIGSWSSLSGRFSRYREMIQWREGHIRNL